LREELNEGALFMDQKKIILEDFIEGRGHDEID
jgi:hypothetical protein